MPLVSAVICNYLTLQVRQPVLLSNRYHNLLLTAAVGKDDDDDNNQFTKKAVTVFAMLTSFSAGL